MLSFHLCMLHSLSLFYFFNFYFYFILLYNTLLVLAYVDMNLPQVYMSSQTWTPLPPPTPHHPSGSSLCTSPKHPASCIEHRLAIRFLHDSIHVVFYGMDVPQVAWPFTFEGHFDCFQFGGIVTRAVIHIYFSSQQRCILKRRGKICIE